MTGVTRKAAAGLLAVGLIWQSEQSHRDTTTITSNL